MQVALKTSESIEKLGQIISPPVTKVDGSVANNSEKNQEIKKIEQPEQSNQKSEYVLSSDVDSNICFNDISDMVI